MTEGQLIPAFIAQLLVEEVDANAIERAVGNVRALRLGESISNNNPTFRAFANEQTDLLKRALM